MTFPQIVVPVKAATHALACAMDSRLRGNDGLGMGAASASQERAE
jgi:hypothetical protein